jgi:predicted kinase
MQCDPVLILMCGKIASGKSTLARRLGEVCAAVIIHEDEWLRNHNAFMMR